MADEQHGNGTEGEGTLTEKQAERIARRAARAVLKNREVTEGDAASAASAAGEAVATQAEREGIALSDADADRIAERTIGALEERGAFAQEPSPPEPPAQPGSEGDQGEAEGAGQAQAGEPPSGNEGPPAPEPEPRRRSFAERFQGKR